MKRNMRMLVTASIFVPFLMLYGMFELYFNNSGEFGLPSGRWQVLSSRRLPPRLSFYF